MEKAARESIGFGEVEEISPDWEKRVTEDVGADLINRLHVYCSSTAADLFQAAWPAFDDAMSKRRTVNRIYRMLKAEPDNELVHAAHQEDRRDQVLRMAAEESTARGRTFLDQLTRAGQRDLAGHHPASWNR